MSNVGAFGSGAGTVDDVLGNAYLVVKHVFDNMGDISSIASRTEAIDRIKIELDLAEDSVLTQTLSIIVAGMTNFRSTFSEALIDFVEGEYFTSTESGELRIYKRTAGVPGYTDQGDVVAPVSRSQLAALTGASNIGTTGGGTVQSELNERPTSAALADDTGATLVGSDDGASGTLWTTIAGFITRLMSSAGSSVIGFITAGTGSATKTAQAKMRETRSATDKSGNFTAQLTSWLADVGSSGGTIRSGTGNLVMTAGVVVEGDFTLIGEGRLASIINPNFGGTVFDFDAGPGNTVYSNRLIGHAFYSTNTDTKTLVRLRNTANCEVSHNSMGEGHILGTGSIGVLVAGREMNWLHDNVWAVEKCVRIVPNTDALYITTDYMVSEREHYLSQSATEACVESTGAYLSNTVWRDCALVKGAEGFKLVNTTLAANSYCLTIMNTRREQSQTATAYSYHFNFTGASATLKNLLFAQNYADRTQKGFYGQGIKRASLISSLFPQDGVGGTPTQAIDYALPVGGTLTLLDCVGAVGGVKTITDGHPILEVPSTITNDPIGSLEHWARWVTPADPGSGGTYVYDNLPYMKFGGISVASFEMTLPTGSRYVRLPQLPANTAVSPDATGAEVFVRSKDGRMHLFYPADGTAPTTIAATGIFSATAAGNKIYGDGYANGIIGNTLAATQVIHVEVRK